MLSNLGIRAKLLAVLSVPMVFLIVVSAVLVTQAEGSSRKADQVRQVAITSTNVVAYVHQLQLERGATLTYLAAKNQANRAVMLQARDSVNVGVGDLGRAIKASPLSTLSPATAKAVGLAAQQQQGVGPERSQIDAGQADQAQVQNFYGIVIDEQLALIDSITEQVNDPALSSALRNYLTMSSTLEQAAQERDLVAIGGTQGKLSQDQRNQLVAVAAQEDSLLDQLQAQLPKSDVTALSKAMANAAQSYSTDRNLILSSSAGTKLSFDVDDWNTSANDRFDDLVKVEQALGQHVAKVAGDIGAAAQRRALLVGGLTLLGILIALGVTLLFSRRITAPLTRLTDAAEELRGELPRMVEQMQTPGETADLVVTPIEVSGRDEIGRLATAFNSVNDVTVRVALEQAALRGSIAEMFVNVARRNQTLLGRQLSFLDQLESREENPDTLEDLFKLDHLAARMRRNAESLLVLAGIDATRRLRTPMALSDVLRTAIGEIESYERVDLTVDVDPPVSGRHALAVAHLVAELIDNATHFSNPGTRVEVATSVGVDGSVNVLINDAGLGMTEDEIIAANERLADPPASEVAVAQRLGLYVVGRIAKRLGMLVGLRQRRTGGTAATVNVPASVLVGVPTAPAVEQVEPVEPFEPVEQVQTPAPGAEAEPTEPVAPVTEPAVPVAASPSLPARRRPAVAPEPTFAASDPLNTDLPLPVDPSVPALPAALAGDGPVGGWQPEVLSTDTAPLVSRAEAPLTPRRRKQAEQAAEQAAEAIEQDPAAPVAATPADSPRGRRGDFFRRRSTAAQTPAQPAAPAPADDEPVFALPEADLSIGMPEQIEVSPELAGLSAPEAELPVLDDGVAQTPAVPQLAPDLAAPAVQPAVQPPVETVRAAPDPQHAPESQPVAEYQPAAEVDQPQVERPSFAAELSALSRDEQPPAAPAAASTDVATTDTLNQLVQALGGGDQAPAQEYVPEAEELTTTLAAAQDILPQRGRAAKAPRGRARSRRKAKGEQPVAPVAPQPAPRAAVPAPPPAAPTTEPVEAPVAQDVPAESPYGDDLAFRALAELSQLSGGYEPNFAPAGGLAKRQPRKAEPVAAAAVPAQRPHVERDAEQVRGRLSGFRAGVQRGRTTDADPTEARPSDTNPLIDSTTGKEGPQ